MAGRFLLQRLSSRMSRSLLQTSSTAATIAASPARYFNTFSRSPAASKTRWTTTNSVRPAFVDSAGGKRRCLSSNTSRGPTIDEHAAALNRTTTIIMGLAICNGLMRSDLFDKKHSNGGKSQGCSCKSQGSDSKSSLQ